MEASNPSESYICGKDNKDQEVDNLGEDGVRKKRKWWFTNSRMNRASFGADEKRVDDDTPDFTILVGDLGLDVTDDILQETFKSHYTSIKGAKVVMDRITGRGKGCGFVRFGDESEHERALTEMNGVYCSSRPMRIGLTANKQATNSQHHCPKVLEGLEMAMTEDIISESYKMEIDDGSDLEKGKQYVPASSEGRFSLTTPSEKIRRSLQSLFLNCITVFIGLGIIGITLVVVYQYE